MLTNEYHPFGGIQGAAIHIVQIRFMTYQIAKIFLIKECCIRLLKNCMIPV